MNHTDYFTNEDMMELIEDISTILNSHKQERKREDMQVKCNIPDRHIHDSLIIE